MLRYNMSSHRSLKKDAPLRRRIERVGAVNARPDFTIEVAEFEFSARIGYRHGRVEAAEAIANDCCARGALSHSAPKRSL